MRTRLPAIAAAVLFTAMVGAAATGEQYAGRPTANVPTFTKHVAPIFYENCTSCHRPGEIAPMSLLTYEDARPWARSIRDEVNEGHMPPWHAEAPSGTFANERRLGEEDKETIIRWVAGGAPKGDPADQPPLPTYPEGWTIGTPDVVFEMPEEYEVPAEGIVQYEYFYIPTNFTEPKWVKAIEVRPGARSVVHHVLVHYHARPDIQRTPVISFNRDQSVLPPSTPGISRSPVQKLDMPLRLIGTYAPGANPQAFPEGTAMRLEPGGIIRLQMHYTTTGEATKDRTRVGLIYAKEPNPREIRVSQFYNSQFVLPAGEPDVKVDAEVTFVNDATLFGLFPHTHLRGKRWEYVLERPDGTKTSILSVPRYDFNWQTYYMFREPLHVPKGSRIVSSAWYDNSRANVNNPDPKVDVRWGDQTWEEMQYTGIVFSPASPLSTPTTAQSGPGGR